VSGEVPPLPAGVAPRLADCPLQIDTEGLALAVGLGFTVTTTVSVAVPPPLQ